MCAYVLINNRLPLLMGHTATFFDDPFGGLGDKDIVTVKEQRDAPAFF